jgi:hypothetical protein
MVSEFSVHGYLALLLLGLLGSWVVRQNIMVERIGWSKVDPWQIRGKESERE